MPLGLFGNAGVTKLQQVDQRSSSTGHSSTESKDGKGCVVRLPKHIVTIEKKLAEGGFAIVFLASDKHNRRYALKRQFINDDPRQLEACQREYRIVNCLSGHKNIIQYADHLLSRSISGVYEYSLLTVYYKHSVLQLMNERLANGLLLSANEILSIFCDMCEAVARLHHSRTSVIHRDLKVENVLIDDRRRGAPPIYVLCDFGSATTKILSIETHSLRYIEEDINRYTTLSYRSPEMIDPCSRHPIGVKSDIWAMGIMLYKLCYFTLPFGESSLAIQNCSYTFPVEPTIPGALQAIIKCLLEVDIERRPDIFQASALAFEAKGQISPISNLNETRRITLSEAIARLKGKTQIKRDGKYEIDAEISSENNRFLTNVKSEDTPILNTDEVHVEDCSVTSVTPRLRPKPLASLNRFAMKLDGFSPIPTRVECAEQRREIKGAEDRPQKLRLQSSSSNPDFEPGSHLNRTVCHSCGEPRETASLKNNQEQNIQDMDSPPNTARSCGDVEKNKKSLDSGVGRLKSSAFKPYSAERGINGSKNFVDLKKNSYASSKKSIESVDVDNSSWNPFLDAPFEIEKFREGTYNNRKAKSGSSSYKSSFVCRSPELDLADPFGAAPFDCSILQQKRRNVGSVVSANEEAAGDYDSQCPKQKESCNINYTNTCGVEGYEQFSMQISIDNSDKISSKVSSNENVKETIPLNAETERSRVADTADVGVPMFSSYNTNTEFYVMPDSPLHKRSISCSTLPSNARTYSYPPCGFNPGSSTVKSPNVRDYSSLLSSGGNELQPSLLNQLLIENSQPDLDWGTLGLSVVNNPFEERAGFKEDQRRKSACSSSSNDEYPMTDDSGAEIFSSVETTGHSRFSFSPHTASRKKIPVVDSISLPIVSSASDTKTAMCAKSSPLLKKTSKHCAAARRGTRESLQEASFVNSSYQAEDWESPSQ